MKVKKEIVTPFLVFVFLIVALSGIFMFFHLLDDYTNVVHEFLGLTFAAFAILHIINNWRSILNYSSKRLLVLPAIVSIVISIAFIIGDKLNGNIEREVIDKFLKSPITVSFKVLDVDYDQAVEIFKKNNIMVKDSLESIETISTSNQKSPEETIELLMK